MVVIKKIVIGRRNFVLAKEDTKYCLFTYKNERMTSSIKFCAGNDSEAIELFDEYVFH